MFLVVLLIQGWSESGAWLNALIRTVLENIFGVKVVVADYLDGKGKLAQFKSHLTVEQYADTVLRYYLQAQFDYPRVPIMVVGHSLGGVIARRLCAEGYFPSREMVLVGTPNLGITYKSIGGSMLGLLICPLLWVLSSKYVCNVPAFRQLLRGSKFLKELNKDGIPQDAYYISGKNDTTVPSWSSDPHGIGSSVECNHHLFPFNGRDVESLSEDELDEADKSAIPTVVSIVEKKLAEIKTASN
ncbi:MAG: alpha/beta hydrolase [Candidatus Pacebacteria bacterium]|nr:alpha/beta hydrolase [Candidatus Paceibacterota bacterium]